MNIRSLTTLFLAGLLGAGVATFSSAQEQSDSETVRDPQARTPAGMASGYPPAGGKGPGSGHSYQTGTGGTGQGSPQYQGDHGTTTAPIVEPDPTGSAEIPEQHSGTAAAAESGVPLDTPAYPYGWRGHPYSRGQGYGYGRYGRGYGYGYPGYRGLGGTPYRHHRQFGNPPFYPAPPASRESSSAE